jgi:hypothetical protein
VPGLLRRGTRDALTAQHADVEFADVGGSSHAYFDLFAELWHAGETFMLVEHDIVIAPGTVMALEQCDRAWCACPIGVTYRHKGSTCAWFQCNRWRRELMVRYPDLLDDVPEHLRDWKVQDSVVAGRIRTVEREHTHLDLLTFHLAAGMGSTQ